MTISLISYERYRENNNPKTIRSFYNTDGTIAITGNNFALDFGKNNRKDAEKVMWESIYISLLPSELKEILLNSKELPKEEKEIFIKEGLRPGMCPDWGRVKAILYFDGTIEISNERKGFENKIIKKSLRLSFGELKTILFKSCEEGKKYSKEIGIYPILGDIRQEEKDTEIFDIGE